MRTALQCSSSNRSAVSLPQTGLLPHCLIPPLVGGLQPNAYWEDATFTHFVNKSFLRGSNLVFMHTSLMVIPI